MYIKYSSISSGVFTFPITLLAITGLIYPVGYNLLPSTIFFELMLFSVIGFSLIKGGVEKKSILISVLLVIYFISSLLYALSQGVHVYDFVQAYKFIVYLSLIMLVSQWIKLDVIKLYWIILSVFFVKYLYSRALGFDDRPGVFTENNYELIFLLFLFYAKNKIDSKFNFIEVLVLFSVFLLSGSRSGLLGLVIVLSFLYVRIDRKLVYYIPALLLSGVLLLYVFIDRMGAGGVESIDRVVFLNAFLYEVRDWGVYDFLVGAPRITPMTDLTCSALSFYQKLFSKGDSIYCYSVILHSFIMRIIFDHGVLVLIGVFLLIFSRLKAFSSNRDAFAIITVLFATSLSVSSINNAYAMLGVVSCLMVFSSQRDGYGFKEIKEKF